MSELSLSWLFSSELPLPAGLELAMVCTATEELGKIRLIEAGKLLGAPVAQELAEKLGTYEVGSEQAKALGLEGLRLEEEGGFPALSPARWGLHPQAESWMALRARMLECGGEVMGLSLNPEQRAGFLRFLGKHRVIPAGASELERIVELARHFFFAEPLNVVVRYTGPRFHHA